MSARLAGLAVCLVVATGALAGDLEPERTIYVPDSLSGLMYSRCAAYNPVTDKVYVGGAGNCVIVIDCATNKKVARIPTKSGCSAIFCSPVNGKVYCVGGLLTVIDGASDTVVKTLPVSRPNLCYNSRREHLYAYGGRWGENSPIVIDTRTDSIVGTIGMGTAALCYNSHDDMIYNKSDGHWQGLNRVTVLRGSNLSEVANIPVKDGPGTLCYNSANNKVYCADYGTKTLTVIDGTSNAVLTTIAADSGLVDMCCNPRDNKIYLSNGAHAPRAEDDCIGPGRRPRPYHDYGDSAVTVIDGATDEVLTTVRTHGRPFELEYDSASNKVLVATQGGSIGASLESLLTSPKPGQAFAAGGSGTRIEPDRSPRVEIIDGGSNQLTASARLAQQPVAFCFDTQKGEAYCITGDRDHSGVVALSVATGSEIADLRTGRSPGVVSYNSRDNKLYCSIPTDRELMVLDGATDHVLARVALERIPGRMCYNSRNDKLYCQVSEANQVLVLDGRTDKAKSKLEMGAPMWYDPQNNRVYSFKGLWNGGRVLVTDGATDSTIAEVPVPSPSAICGNPSTNTIYCSGHDGGVAVIDGRTNTRVTTVRVDYAGSICCDARNNKVYCASWLLDNVTVIDGATNSVDTMWNMAARALCYNGRDNRLYLGGGLGLLVLDATTYDTTARFSEYQGIETIYHDTKNNCVYCVGADRVVVLDGATSRVLRTYALGRGSYSLAHNTAQDKISRTSREPAYLCLTATPSCPGHWVDFRLARFHQVSVSHWTASILGRRHRVCSEESPLVCIVWD